MAIMNGHVQGRILVGLSFALNQLRPGVVLVGNWSLEQKSSWETCGSSGTCWRHGVDIRRWPQMVAEAADQGTSPYDITECYAEETKIYFGSGQAELDSEPLQLRAHITYTLSSGSEMFICVVWIKGREVAAIKCAAGFSAHYSPSEFHLLGMERTERSLPPPRELRFT